MAKCTYRTGKTTLHQLYNICHKEAVWQTEEGYHKFCNFHKRFAYEPDTLIKIQTNEEQLI